MDGLGLDIIEAVIAQEYNVILIDLMSYTNELPSDSKESSFAILLF